jgi:16S rRNA (uracil1498-N3)-methyltransferase
MIRLYTAESLFANARVMLDEARAHYVRNVMRLRDGDCIGAFNARDGEWEASIHANGKRDVALVIGKKLSAPRPCPDVWIAFAAIKNKNELVVEKATELGVSAIHPIITQHSVVKSLNTEKLQLHAMEAAEQCERFDIPVITPHKNLATFLGKFPTGRILLYGDESGTQTQPLPALPPQPLCILIGPEGGFSAEEHRMLQTCPFAQGFSMGPRILRADTAAISALACVMRTAGDWHHPPHFRANT